MAEDRVILHVDAGADAVASAASALETTTEVRQEPCEALEGGWARGKRESRQCWYARLRGHQDGPERKKHRVYIQQWKDDMSENQRLEWEKAQLAKAHGLASAALSTQPSAADQGSQDLLATVVADVAESTMPQPPNSAEVLAADGPDSPQSHLTIPDDYDLRALTKAYKEISATHSSRLSNDQLRWEMYAKFLLLVRAKKASMDDITGKVAELHIAPKKLRTAKQAFGNGPLPAECPAIFRSGRSPDLKLTEAERLDLLNYILYHASTAQALTVEQCRSFVWLLKPWELCKNPSTLNLKPQILNRFLRVRRCIVLLHMEKQGLFLDAGLTADAALARVDELNQRYKVDDVWTSCKEWVKAARPQEDWLTLKKLKPRTKPEVTSCTPEVVQRAFNNLFGLLREEKIMDSNDILLESEAARLLCTDEKGLSQRAGSNSKAVIDAAHSGSAVGMVGEANFEHVTLTSFVSAAGDAYPLGIVTPTKRLHPDFGLACPGAVFAANESGSTTAQTFCYFTLECCLKKARARVGPGKSLVLILNSGGGALLHVSVPLVALCLEYGCKLFYLPAYTTHCLMPLEQNVHVEFSRLWTAFRQAWACKSAPNDVVRSSSRRVCVQQESPLSRNDPSQLGEGGLSCWQGMGPECCTR